jgi:hypothetical protein
VQADRIRSPGASAGEITPQLSIIPRAQNKRRRAVEAQRRAATAPGNSKSRNRTKLNAPGSNVCIHPPHLETVHRIDGGAAGSVWSMLQQDRRSSKQTPTLPVRFKNFDGKLLVRRYY